MIRVIIASSIVLGLTGLFATLAHRASASVRHAIWLIGLVTSLGVGGLAAIGPVLDVESTLAGREPGIANRESLAPNVEIPVTIPDFQIPNLEGRISIPDSRFSIPVAIWLLGVALIIGRTLLAHVAVARLIDRSRHLDVDRRIEVDGAIDVRVSTDVDGPFTLGARNPVILLPLEAEQWDRERLHIVLVHEAAHVARLDYVAQLVATTACALYWFNPISWLAASRLRAEAEHAADDRVLAAGFDGVTYASHLLELARPERAPLSTAVAVGMARGTSRLERRFTAMLDSTRSRGVVPLRLQAVVGTATIFAAVPFTSLRLVPVAPNAPIAITSPAPMQVIAPVALATTRPAVRPSVNRATRQPAKADSIVERTLPASSGERIYIDLRPAGGSITIHGWNQPQVRMRAVLSGNQVRETRLMFDRAGNGVELRTAVDYVGNNYSSSNRFELWIPRKFDVQISSSGGGIAIDGVEGTFSGNTGGGEITLDGVNGVASLTTGGGEVTVTNSNLNGRVTTGGGQALVTNTSGNVSVTSGSGPVIRDRMGQTSTRSYGVGGLATTVNGGSQPMIVVDGKVLSGGGYSYNSAGGDIRLESVPNGGSFNTGGGAIVVGSVGGTASFTTGGGDIKISNVADDISVATGAGTVEISVISGNGTARNVSIATGLGRVVIELPPNLDARFDIESAYSIGYSERNGPTRIDSDFPLTVTETQEWDSTHGTPRRFVRGSGSVGSGRGLIKIRTNNGDVVIRRR